MSIKSSKTKNTRKKRDFKTWILDKFPVPKNDLSSFRIVLFVDDEDDLNNDDDWILLRE